MLFQPTGHGVFYRGCEADGFRSLVTALLDDPDSGDGLLRRIADSIFVRAQDKLKLYWLYERSARQPARRAA